MIRVILVGVISWQKAGAAIVLGLLLTGCCSVAKKTGRVAGTVAMKTVTLTVTSSAKVACTAIKTSGSVVKCAGSAAGQVGRTAAVTLTDTATGISRDVPWVEGMKLYAASKTAEFDTYLRAFSIVSGAAVHLIDSNKIRAGAPEPTLRPGDKVYISNLTPGPMTSARRFQ